MNNNIKHYKITSPLVLLTHSDIAPDAGKRYELAIRDLPAHEKPREKMLAHGASSLSIQELLAVLLNTGTKKEGVLAMTSRILRDYGQKNIFAEPDVKKMAGDLDIPLAKALQIAAAGELGRRFFRRDAHGAVVLRTADEVFKYVAEMQNLAKEHLRGIYLNAHYQIIYDETISIGTVDANIVHPREVFRPAISYGAVAVILVHNHPSGVLKPSDEDARITRQIAEAGKLIGIELVDHIIITKDGFVSIPTA